MPNAHRSRRVRVALILAGGLMAVGACGSSPSVPTASATAVATPSPSGVVSPSIAATASPPLETSFTPGPSAATVPIDPGLLDLLPSTVAGIPVTEVPNPSGIDDPTLVSTVERLVEAVVIDPASGDFAYASIIVLRSGVYDAAFFTSWRDSFDVGACSQAGGVTGHSQATIGGRMTYIGKCSGGVLTYHVRLAAEDAIVSVSSLGPSHLGQKLLTGLRP